MMSVLHLVLWCVLVPYSMERGVPGQTRLQDTIVDQIVARTSHLASADRTFHPADKITLKDVINDDTEDPAVLQAKVLNIFFEAIKENVIISNKTAESDIIGHAQMDDVDPESSSYHSKEEQTKAKVTNKDSSDLTKLQQPAFHHIKLKGRKGEEAPLQRASTNPDHSKSTSSITSHVKSDQKWKPWELCPSNVVAKGNSTHRTRVDGTIIDEITAIIEEFWDLVSLGEILIVSEDLDNLFSRYDPSIPARLKLAEVDFLSGDESWMKDFARFGMQCDYSKAYFRVLDVFSGMFDPPRLTLEDMDEIIDICESLTNSRIGFISHKQFETGFNEKIFRGLPVSLLFVRYNMHNPEVYVREGLNDTEFMSIFKDMDDNNDGVVSSEEMSTFWETNNHGPQDQGQTLFTKLDINNVGHLTEDDWTAVMTELDCRGGVDTEQVDFLEFLQLDSILHDERAYPNGLCFVK